MKLTIGKKLGLGFGTILVLMLASTLLTYWRLSEIIRIQEYVLQVRVPSIERLRSLQKDLNNTGLAVRRVILAAGQAERRDAAKKIFDSSWPANEKDLADLEKLAGQWLLQENRDGLARIREQLPKLLQVSLDTMEGSTSRTPNAMAQAGNDLTDKGSTINGVIQKNLGNIVDSQIDHLKGENEQIASAKSSLYWTMGATTVLALVIGLVVAALLGRRISTTTNGLLLHARAIAQGDLTQDELRVLSQDELGEITTAINTMQNNLKNMIMSISENAQQVATASEEFSSTSQQITTNSEETSAQANVVSAATEEINRNLQTVATSTEEMSASISEIAKNATEAAKVAGEALKAATQTNTTVVKLGESSTEIGQVIKVITSIAQQTNLLALNATIEAARAGEAGKGFAVVANEVKELAKQTAKATEDISHRIAAIQSDAKGAVDAIKMISGIIGQVSDISSTIATAVEEQSATTSEMSRNVTEAAKGSGEVAKNITGVAHAAQNTSHGATESQRAAQSLAQMSTELRELVGQFKIDSNGHGHHAAA